jgi:hypothetical protein
MGARRYVSASERAKILAQGLVRYSLWMDSNQQKGNVHYDYWVEWQELWGQKMSQRVEEIHDQNFTWATNYSE